MGKSHVKVKGRNIFSFISYSSLLLFTLKLNFIVIAVDIVIAILFFVAVHFFGQIDQRPQGTVPVSQIFNEVAAGNISELTISGNKVTAKGKGNTVLTAYQPENGSFLQLLRDQGVSTEGVRVTVTDSKASLRSMIEVAFAPFVILVNLFTLIGIQVFFVYHFLKLLYKKHLVII